MTENNNIIRTIEIGSDDDSSLKIYKGNSLNYLQIQCFKKNKMVFNIDVNKKTALQLCNFIYKEYAGTYDDELNIVD